MGGEIKIVSNANVLQQLLREPVDTLAIVLQSGEYHLTPFPYIDSTCGNCQDPNTPVPITVGLHLRGNFIRISGPPDKSAIIYTHAGYGLYVDQCKMAVIENLVISGGARDTNGNATDAAIVVKKSTAVIRDNEIRENIGDSAIVTKIVVGIMGIAVREDAFATITGNRILRNSWDGIALYRDAEAEIEDNIIDGVDKATGQKIGGGRGVGIGITWNGKATIRNNFVRRYWKGIGLFVDAQGTIERNIIEDIVTWGISLWDAEKGTPVGLIIDNVIYNTGACGAMIVSSTASDEPGRFVGNVIVSTAQNPKYDSPEYYCYQCALAIHAVPPRFVIEQNVFHNNRRATLDLPDYDIPKEQFLVAVQDRCRELSSNTLFEISEFLREFCTNSEGR